MACLSYQRIFTSARTGVVSVEIALVVVPRVEQVFAL